LTGLDTRRIRDVVLLEAMHSKYSERGMQGDMRELRESVIQLALQHAVIDIGAEPQHANTAAPVSDDHKQPETVGHDEEWGEGGATNGVVSSQAAGAAARVRASAKGMVGVGSADEGDVDVARGERGGSAEELGGSAVESDVDVASGKGGVRTAAESEQGTKAHGTLDEDEDDDFGKLEDGRPGGGATGRSESVVEEEDDDDDFGKLDDVRHAGGAAGGNESVVEEEDDDDDFGKLEDVRHAGGAAGRNESVVEEDDDDDDFGKLEDERHAGGAAGRNESVVEEEEEDDDFGELGVSGHADGGGGKENVMDADDSGKVEGTGHGGDGSSGEGSLVDDDDEIGMLEVIDHADGGTGRKENVLD
jgi:hypothetical protein